MAILTITYDLRKPGRNYDELYKAIKAIGSWAHPVESVWLVNTTQSASIVLSALRQHVDGNDKLLVMSPEAPKWSSVNLDPLVIEWLKKNV